MNPQGALLSVDALARSLFDRAAQAIIGVDQEGCIMDANPMAAEMFGYSRAALIGSSVEMLIPEALRDRHREHRADYIRHPRARPMGLGIDLMARRKDGSEFPVEISLSYVSEDGGLAMALISDITPRKKAERERENLIKCLESAVAEKTVLLKEINHRVKNNLSVIGALLGLQADEIEDDRARAALAESQQRVLSMALIHEYLYADEHLDRVDFGKYIRQLSDQIGTAWTTSAGRVLLRVEGEQIDLPVNRAIPCGLILNELLSNAFKHAFPNGRRGTITVRFRRAGPGRLSLVCEDDGVGVPEGLDWQNANSLGLRIVQILAKQVDGTLNLDRSHGRTRFELLFPAQDV